MSILVPNQLFYARLASTPVNELHVLSIKRRLAAKLIMAPGPVVLAEKAIYRRCLFLFSPPNLGGRWDDRHQTLHYDEWRYRGEKNESETASGENLR